MVKIITVSIFALIMIAIIATAGIAMVKALFKDGKK
jgi:hypothetical protein